MLLTFACALVFSAPAAAGQRACEAANAKPSKAAQRAVARATVCVLNAERARHGLRPLHLNRKLSKAARRHARDMARKNYFSHDSLSGASFVDRIRGTGYLHRAQRWTVAENIAWGSGGRSTPRAIAKAWMQSVGHRANILSSAYREIGVGVVAGAPAHGVSGGATYATDFGARG